MARVLHVEKGVKCAQVIVEWRFKSVGPPSEMANLMTGVAGLCLTSKSGLQVIESFATALVRFSSCVFTDMRSR